MMMHGVGVGMVSWLWVVLPLVVLGGVAFGRLLVHRGRSGRLDHDRQSTLNFPGGTSESSDPFVRSVFRLAGDNDGVLTVSDVVVETGLDPRRAEERLNGLVDGVHITMDVTDEGRIRYEFPELKRQ